MSQFTDFPMLLLLPLIVVAVVTDLNVNRIPNWLTATILVSGLGSQLVVSGFDGVFWGLGGASLGFICFFPFYLKRGMGAGDVKLMAAIGSFLGYKLTLLAVAYTLVFGGLMAFFVVLQQGNVRAMIANTDTHKFKGIITLEQAQIQKCYAT